MKFTQILTLVAASAVAFWTPSVLGQSSTRMTETINDLARRAIVTNESAGPEPAGMTEEAEVQRLLSLAPTRIPVQQGNLSTAIEVAASAASMNFIAPPADDFPEIITVSVNMNPYRFLIQLADQYRFNMRYKDGVWRFTREAAGALVVRTYKLKHTNLDSFKASQNTVQSLSNSVSGSGDSSSASNQGGSMGLPGSTGHVFDVKTDKVIEDIKELIGLPSTSTRAVVVKAGDALPEDEGKRPVVARTSGAKETGAKVLHLPNTNTLYVVATRAQHDYVEAYLRQVDKVEPQVRIVARFIQTTSDPKTVIGVDPSGFQPGFTVSGGGEFDYSRSRGTNVPPTTTRNFSGNAILTMSDLKLQLNALATESDARLVNNPDVTTTNNREVYMSVGSEEPFLESNTTNIGSGLGSAQAKIAYRRIGTTVNITPTIFDDEEGNGRVRLFVQIEVAKLTGFRRINGVDVPVVASEKYLYTVFVPNGHTLAFGGFSGLEESRTESGLPGLRRIPYLGGLFRSRTNGKSQKNLVAYITPTIVKPGDYTLAAAPADSK